MHIHASMQNTVRFLCGWPITWLRAPNIPMYGLQVVHSWQHVAWPYLHTYSCNTTSICPRQPGRSRSAQSAIHAESPADWEHTEWHEIKRDEPYLASQLHACTCSHRNVMCVRIEWATASEIHGWDSLIHDMKALGTIFSPVDLILMHYVGAVGVGNTPFCCLRKLEICARNTNQY